MNLRRTTFCLLFLAVAGLIGLAFVSIHLTGAILFYGGGTIALLGGCLLFLWLFFVVGSGGAVFGSDFSPVKAIFIIVVVGMGLLLIGQYLMNW
jgi:hypothetical protein